MRTTLLGGLLDAAQRNVARDAEHVALFESGRAYLGRPAPSAGGPLAGEFAGRLPAPACEPHRIACLAVGSLAPRSWRGGEDAADFYAIKGVLEVLLGHFDLPLDLVTAAEPFLHPGRSARIEIGGEPAGWVGELHPLVSRGWDLPSSAGFELDLGPLVAGAPADEAYHDLTTHPALLQDLAVVVAEEVSARDVVQAVLAGGGKLLASARVFDVYRGAQAGDGRKSLALRLEFRAPDRTLTDEEVADRREAIKESLAEIGGTLRE